MLPKYLLTSKCTPPLDTASVWPKPQGSAGIASHCWHRHAILCLNLQFQRELARCKPSPLIVCRCCSRIGGLEKCVTSPSQSSSHSSNWQQLQQRVAAAIFTYSSCECSIVNGPLLTVLFSSDQQGSINERPLTIRSQLWLSEHCAVCPSNTQLHLPDNCVIRVCINNWSTKKDMHYSSVCLIC